MSNPVQIPFIRPAISTAPKEVMVGAIAEGQPVQLQVNMPAINIPAQSGEGIGEMPNFIYVPATGGGGGDPEGGTVVYEGYTAQDSNSTGWDTTWTAPSSGNLSIVILATDRTGNGDANRYFGDATYNEIAFDSGYLSGVIYWKIADGGESGNMYWTWDTSARPTCHVIEYSDTCTTIDKEVENDSGASNVYTLSTGTTATLTTSNSLCFAFIINQDAGDIRNTMTWTNDFVEDSAVSYNEAGNVGIPGSMFASLVVTSTDAVETTFTCNASYTEEMYGKMIVWKRS